MCRCGQQSGRCSVTLLEWLCVNCSAQAPVMGLCKRQLLLLLSGRAIAYMLVSALPAYWLSCHIFLLSCLCITVERFLYIIYIYIIYK